MTDIANDAEVERQLRGHLESCHKLDKAEEILENLDNSKHLLESVKNKNTRTASLDGKNFVGMLLPFYIKINLHCVLYCSGFVGPIFQKSEASGGGEKEPSKFV